MSRAGVALDRLSRPERRDVPLPDSVRDLVLEGMRLCEERDRAAGDHERWRDLAREVSYIAGRVGLELDRLAGRPVPQWKVDAVEARRARDVPTAERIATLNVPEPKPQVPEWVRAEIEQRRQAREQHDRMRAALGEPSVEHRELSGLLGGRSP